MGLPCWQALDVHLSSHVLKAWDLLARVDALLCPPSIFKGPVASLIQRHDIRATQFKISPQWLALVVALTFYGDAHDPTSRIRRIDHKIQPAAIAVPSGLRVLTSFLVSVPP
jgi:hypothetical protein